MPSPSPFYCLQYIFDNLLIFFSPNFLTLVNRHPPTTTPNTFTQGSEWLVPVYTTWICSWPHVGSWQNSAVWLSGRPFGPKRPQKPADQSSLFVTSNCITSKGIHLSAPGRFSTNFMHWTRLPSKPLHKHRLYELPPECPKADDFTKVVMVQMSSQFRFPWPHTLPAI